MTIRERITKPLPFGVTWVRLLYMGLGAVIAFVLWGRPKEVTRWKTVVETKVVYKELDNSKQEERDVWVYKPDGTKEVTRYRLKMAKITSEGNAENKTDVENEVIKPVFPLATYHVSGYYTLVGGSEFYGADVATRVGTLPLFGVVGLNISKDLFRIEGTNFYLGVRVEF